MEAKILRTALEYADSNDACKITGMYGVEYFDKEVRMPCFRTNKQST